MSQKGKFIYTKLLISILCFVSILSAFSVGFDGLKQWDDYKTEIYSFEEDFEDSSFLNYTLMNATYNVYDIVASSFEDPNIELVEALNNILDKNQMIYNLKIDGKEYKNGDTNTQKFFYQINISKDGVIQENKYPEEYGDMAVRYEKALKEIGIDRLVNSHAELVDAGIAIYGTQIDKIYFRRFRVAPMQKDYLAQLLGHKDDGKFNILIAHNPDYFPQYAAWGADLVLAGHVHGGMVRIPGWKGIVSPAVRLFPKYDGGLFRIGKSTMLLSRGLGMHTIPIRLFNPGEVLVVDFESEKDN